VTYTDSEIAHFQIRILDGEPLDILPAELRPRFERVRAIAEARLEAEREIETQARLAREELEGKKRYVLILSPSEVGLLRSLANASELRRRFGVN
jgi:hypothetical protein